MGLIAALAGRPCLVLVGAAALIAILILAGVYLTGRGDGARSVTERIDRQDARAEDAADGARRDVRRCSDQGGTWDVATGTCE